MKTILRTVSSTLLVIGAVFCILISNSDAAEWTVTKVSGTVWIEAAGVQKVSLGSGSQLDGGDRIMTGLNGRVMLARGEETILVSPNSAIALPNSPSADLKTTILQQAGSILLSVEKRNVRHFEVQTPYLAAVVKGTRFAVTVSPQGATVNVTEGKVEVADFRSGQIALVLPGQSALVSPNGKPGLSLSGSGKFEAIRQDRPRTPGIKALEVPATGFSGPRGNGVGRSAARTDGMPKGNLFKANGHVRINAPIGEVRVNFTKATGGLARGSDTANAGQSSRQQPGGRAPTVWSAEDSAGAANSANNGNGNGNGTSLALGLGVGGGTGNGNGVGLGLGVGTGNGLGAGPGNGNNGCNGNGHGNGNGNGSC
jgi:hypothetical protein